MKAKKNLLMNIYTKRNNKVIQVHKMNIYEKFIINSYCYLHYHQLLSLLYYYYQLLYVKQTNIIQQQ